MDRRTDITTATIRHQFPSLCCKFEQTSKMA